ncbi:MAG: 6-carboxytetrahydropterin synthase [Vampirovibrionales bacterium]|nr:6-carboxytetrahydropterin synthase [Vampirovibrionales bacterium]
MMPQLLLTRRYDFPASHRLYNPQWSDEANKNVFGPCSHINGHGHNYALWVSITGTPHPDTGMLMDIGALDELVETWILNWVDHKHLNMDVPFLTGKIPTTEVLAQAFWQQLEPHLPSGISLSRVRLQESRNNSAEITQAAGAPAFLPE